MHLLDKRQVHLIESDVEQAKITLETLSEELVDHICCEVEWEMSQGKSFEDAYAIVKSKTGIKILQEIQENTLYLIDKKYALMKTLMKITGNISLILLAMGTLFKISHWPGASIMLVFGFFLLCFFFFPAAIYLNYREGKSVGKGFLYLSILVGGISFMLGILFKVQHWPGGAPLLLIGTFVIVIVFLPALLYSSLKKASSSGEKGMYITGVLGLGIFILSFLFKIFHWPGASMLIPVGSILLVTIFIPLYTYKEFKESGKIGGRFIFIIITAMYAVVLNSLLALNTSSNVLDHFVKQDENAIKVVKYFEAKNKLSSTGTDSIVGRSVEMKDVSDQAKKVEDLILNIKINLLRETNHLDEEAALGVMYDPQQIKGKENSDIATRQLLETGKAKALKDEVVVFMDKVKAATKADPEFSERIKFLLNTDNLDNQSWEERNFRSREMSGTMAFLSILQKNIMMVVSQTPMHSATVKI